MLDEKIMPGRNVVDFARFQEQRKATRIMPLCRYCGADLGEGEREEDCSGAWFTPAEAQPLMKRRFRAE